MVMKMEKLIDETIEYLDNLSGEKALELKKRLIRFANKNYNKISIIDGDEELIVEKHKTNNWLIIKTFCDGKLTCARSISEYEFLDLYKIYVKAIEEERNLKEIWES